MLLDYLEHATVEELYDYFYGTKEQFKHKVNPDLDTTSYNTEDMKELVEVQLEEDIVALAHAYDLSYEEATNDKDNLYLIYDESEIDERAQQAAETLAEDAKGEIPEYLQFYFNEDQYINDLLNQGYGYLLSNNDEEITVVIDNTAYYIYKI